MIGTSTWDYVFIRTCILFLHNVAPVSIFYCFSLSLASILTPQTRHYRAPPLIEFWFSLETLAYFLLFLPYKQYLQRSAVHPAPASRREREELFERCNANVKDPEKYLSQWFLGASKEQIRRENVKEFIRWAFFDTGSVIKAHNQEIDSYVEAMERMLGRPIQAGRGSAKPLRLTLDRVDCLHRSLLWYMCIAVVDTIMYCRMLYNGYHFHRKSIQSFFTVFPFRPLTLFSTYTSPAKHLTYWHRPHNSKAQLPVLFIHGIGVGLYPYTDFLREVGKATNIADHSDLGVIAIEVMPISTRITTPALGRDEMVREIWEIVKYHGWDKFVLVSHSYGSVVASHLLKSRLTNPSIGPVVFIDPITFLLHLPSVAYNFTARTPKRANEFQLWYFGSKDIGVAHTLARHFFWSENILWKEDLQLAGIESEQGRDVTVSLSGKDLIVDTRSVWQYLQSTSSSQMATNGAMPHAMHEKKSDPALEPIAGSLMKRWAGSGLEVLWFEHLDHAQAFDTARDRGRIIETINAYSKKC